MLDFSKDIDISLGLKIVTTLSSGFYAGGCAAIALCTQPAILDLDEKNCLKATKGMLQRAHQMPLSHVIATSTGLAAYIASARTTKDSSWLAAVIGFGAIIPYTIIMLGPINGRITKGQVDDWDVKPLLTKWLVYHRIRTVAALGLFGYFTYLLSAGK